MLAEQAHQLQAQQEKLNALTDALAAARAAVPAQAATPPAGPPEENLSFMNITPCATKQERPIVTPSQIKL